MQSNTSDQGQPDSGADSTRRMKATSVHLCKGIIYGNNAIRIDYPREDGHTHKWTVYVKPYKNEDMSTYVEKVNFRLHESFKKPSRDVTEPPYEVTETGWGEFEIRIQIYFKDPGASSSPQVTMYHILQLFKHGQHPGGNTCDTPLPVPPVTPGVPAAPLVFGYYEEVIFWSPSLAMRELLLKPPPLVRGTYEHDIDYETKEAETKAAILAAKQKIKHILAITMARYDDVQEEIKMYKQVETSRLAVEKIIGKKGKKKANKGASGKMKKKVGSVKLEEESKSGSDSV